MSERVGKLYNVYADFNIPAKAVWKFFRSKARYTRFADAYKARERYTNEDNKHEYYDTLFTIERHTSIGVYQEGTMYMRDYVNAMSWLTFLWETNDQKTIRMGAIDGRLIYPLLLCPKY